MNLSAAELRENALRLLGIKDEAQLKAIGRLVETRKTDEQESNAALPDMLILLAQSLAAPDYLERSKRILPVPVADEIIKAAHEIYNEELAQVINHPSFLAAREKLRRKINNAQQTDKNSNQEGLEPIATVEGVTCTPFLMGHVAPYVPVLKVAITNQQHRVLWSDLLHWFDLIFISKALLEQVSEHAQNSENMIKSGMIAMLEPSKIKGALTELNIALANLEKAIAPLEDS
ncbi:hypothetical protein [Prosthecobacter sp.]|uniref:hypothetical protein n=1 Tax=Prosthecobacter sp. TaxID=1965333 RepID=UPI003784CEB2